MRENSSLAAVRALILAVLFITSGCTQTESTGQSNSQDDVAAISGVVTQLLESNPASTTDLFGRTPDRIACVSKAFGLSKTPAAPIGDGAIFAHVYCAAVDSGVNFDDASAFSGPIAVLVGPPVKIEVPLDGAENEASIRQIFPNEIETAALNSVADEGMKRELRQRYAARQQS
ncbi:hypothetical protein [Micromonospora zamorensis]|uniref:hypothetical protein n=1 Tax=Micromonospora zamorensis TaxID=709883 RepID=UPI0033CC8CC0